MSVPTYLRTRPRVTLTLEEQDALDLVGLAVAGAAALNASPVSSSDYVEIMHRRQLLELAQDAARQVVADAEENRAGREWRESKRRRGRAA